MIIPNDSLTAKPIRLIPVQVPMTLTIAEAQMLTRFRMMQRESLAIVEIGADGFPKSWDVREKKKEIPSQ